MPKKTLLFVLVSMVLFSGCQPKPEESALVPGSEDVSLASEEGMSQALTAEFLSQHQSFSYALTYDGALATLTETEDTSNPYFEIQGGTTIHMDTDWVAVASDEAEMAGKAVPIGAYEGYQLMDSEGACSLNVTLIPYSEEVLRVTLKVCEGQDGDLGREALGQMLEHLVISSK